MKEKGIKEEGLAKISFFRTPRDEEMNEIKAVKRFKKHLQEQGITAKTVSVAGYSREACVPRRTIELVRKGFDAKMLIGTPTAHSIPPTPKDPRSELDDLPHNEYRKVLRKNFERDLMEFEDLSRRRLKKKHLELLKEINLHDFVKTIKG